MNFKAISAFAVAVAIGTGAHAANLVANGSFSADTYLGADGKDHSHEFGDAYIGQTLTSWTSVPVAPSTPATAFNVWFDSQADADGPDPGAATRFGTHAQYLWTLPPTPDPDGGAFVVLDGDVAARASLQQMITGLVVGKVYTLSFDWATVQYRTRTGATTEKIQVNFGGDTFTTTTINNPSHGAKGWFTVTHKFKATSTSELLSFLSIGTPVGLPPAAALDGVSLVGTVPEPASWAMMIIGFFGLGAMLRRRRQASATA
jgi:hypothetical protein